MPLTQQIFLFSIQQGKEKQNMFYNLKTHRFEAQTTHRFPPALLAAIFLPIWSSLILLHENPRFPKLVSNFNLQVGLINILGLVAGLILGFLLNSPSLKQDFEYEFFQTSSSNLIQIYESTRKRFFQDIGIETFFIGLTLFLNSWFLMTHDVNGTFWLFLASLLFSGLFCSFQFFKRWSIIKRLNQTIQFSN